VSFSEILRVFNVDPNLPRFISLQWFAACEISDVISENVPFTDCVM
jgi:hypothetical protein